MPARYVRSRTRTSCSRRNEGPGGGSRSGTAARIGRPGSVRPAERPRRWRAAASASAAGAASGAWATGGRSGGGFGFGLAESSSSSSSTASSPAETRFDLVDDGLGRGRILGATRPGRGSSTLASARSASASAWRFATSASSSSRRISRRTARSGGASAPASAGDAALVRVLAADPRHDPVARPGARRLGAHDAPRCRWRSGPEVTGRCSGRRPGPRRTRGTSRARPCMWRNTRGRWRLRPRRTGFPRSCRACYPAGCRQEYPIGQGGA